MEDTTISRITDALLDAYGYEDALKLQHREQHLLSIPPLELGGKTDPALQAALSTALAPLPDDALWAISHPEPGVYVLTEEELFLISVNPDHKTATPSSKKTRGNVSLGGKKSEPEPEDIGEPATRHVWTFRYADAAEDGPDMLRRIGGIVFHRSKSTENWPDRGEQLACALAARTATPSGGRVLSRGIEQDLLAAARWHRWHYADGRFQRVIKDAVMYHHLTAEQISDLTGVPTDEIAALNDAPDLP